MVRELKKEGNDLQLEIKNRYYATQFNFSFICMFTQKPKG
jgi:hypothetical protein